MLGYPKKGIKDGEDNPWTHKDGMGWDKIERQNPSSAPKGDKESQRSVNFPNLDSLTRFQIWCPHRGSVPGAYEEHSRKT